MMSRAGWLAPVIICTLLLSGCASADSDLTGESSTQLQSLVVSVAETAATGDVAAALAELDALQQVLDAARARGDVSDERAETIQAAIDLVRVDLEQATEPEPTAPVESPTSVVPETDEDGNSGNGNGNDGDGGDGNDGNSGDGNDGDGDGNNGNGNSGNRGNGNG